MKKLVFILTVLIALQYGLNAKNCYIRLSDDSGVAPSQEQLMALENAACRLRKYDVEHCASGLMA
ncbi:MAG: hypothetical protein J0L99_00305 [Chitinophagales bacterium]|nr:hypothetical protein [Chitinophagales bacterium]